jgi:hypothetical protein
MCLLFVTTQTHSVQHYRVPFDDQLAHIYARKLYLEYRQTFNNSTAFRMDANPDVNQRGGGDFC